MAFQPRNIAQFSEAAVTVDLDKCIAHKGCTVCIDVCPMDVLSVTRADGSVRSETKKKRDLAIVQH